MKNHKSKLHKKMFAAILTVLMICGLCYAKPAKINPKQFVGTWFWDFGYNQNEFSRDEVTFDKNNTFEIFSINKNYTEYDAGKYSIINDDKYGPTLVLNIQKYKTKIEDEWQKLDIKIFFAVESIDNDKFIMHRYRRDLTNVGYGVVDFDPPIYNVFTKVKPGDKENLIGSWTINKIGTPDCTWDETWTYKPDGSFESSWSENGEETNYKGTYDIKKSKTGSVLHQKITQENTNNSGYKEINPPMEFWYDLKINNENVINASCTKNKIGGEEHNYTPAKENIYCRNLELVSYTYHFANYTFTDYAPKGKDYELPGLNKQYLFFGVHYDLLKQQLENWYDNQELKGQPVKTISAGKNTTDREFWADWSLKCNKNIYDPQNGKYNHDFTLPVSILESHMQVPENPKIPVKGEKITVILSGKLSRDIDIDWGLRFVDRNNDEWNEIAGDWHRIKTKDKNLLDIFELEFRDNVTTGDFNKLCFNIAYNPDTLDEPISISDFKFEILDKKSESKILQHNLHYGNFTFKYKAVAGYETYLPEHPDQLPYITNFWTTQNNEFLGWYDNPDFKGTPVTKLSASENNKVKDLYGKYNLKFNPAEPSDNGGFYSNRNTLVKSVIPDAKINPKAGDIVKVAVSGTVSKDYAGYMGMDLANVFDGYDFLGNDWHYVETKNKKLQAYFEIQIQKDANFKTMDDASFLLAYNPLTEGEQLILSDFKFEFVDKDPFVTTEAETKHVVVKPCAEGLEFTIRKLPSEKGNWQGNCGINYNPAGYDSWIWINDWAINEKKTITVIWPFCEKGKIYKFEFTWNDENGKWHNEILSVIATTGKGDLNIKALDNLKLSLESNSKEAVLSVTNLKTDSILNVTKNYSDIIKYVQIEFPFVSGKKDWSDTEWLFGQTFEIYPNTEDNSFYIELFSNGKSNMLGDHNFWWGDKAAINKALSARPQFWTELRIHYGINGYSEGTGFSVGLKRTDSPYVPVKF